MASVLFVPETGGQPEMTELESTRLDQALLYCEALTVILDFGRTWKVLVHYDPTLSGDSLAQVYVYDRIHLPYRDIKIVLGPELLRSEEYSIGKTLYHELLHVVLAPLSTRLRTVGRMAFEKADGDWDDHPLGADDSSVEESVVVHLERTMYPLLEQSIDTALQRIQRDRSNLP